MTNSVRIIESQETFLNLTSFQATLLSQLGRDLASNSTWWGADADAEVTSRSVISVIPDGQERFRVRVHDCVGVIVLPEIRIYVEPKIPLDHFNYIARFSIAASSKGAEDKVSLESGDGFLELVASWFIEEVALLARKGPVRGYRERTGSLTYLKGAVDVRRSMSNILKGRLELESRFEDFSFDTWENRLIATALKSPIIEEASSQGARNNVALVKRYFRDVPTLQDLSEIGEFSSAPKHYRPSLRLAMSVVLGSGRSLSDGNQVAKSFLMRTPLLIENGIREVIASGVRPLRISRGGRQLVPTTLRVNPDIEATSVPYTADVKYKLQSQSWVRPDLSQAVFFATAYGSPLAAVISFDRTGVELDEVPVGPVRVKSLVWDISTSSRPEVSAAKLIADFSTWVQSAGAA